MTEHDHSIVHDPADGGAEATQPDQQGGWQKFIQDVGQDKFEDLIRRFEQSAGNPDNEQADFDKRVAELLRNQLPNTAQETEVEQ